MDIDLDISNYSIKDLETFFKLKPKYTATDVETNEYKIREQLLESGHVNKRVKRDLIEFMKTAKDWLLFAKFGETLRKSPSIIPDNFRLDPVNLPVAQKEPTRTRADNELVEREERKFVYSQNSEFFAGNMNPLETRVISKCLTIDSRFRENYDKTKSSDFIINLPSCFYKVVSMQLSALEFPVSFYCISSSYGNNFLYLYANTQFYIGGPVEQYEMVVIVPDGNYNVNDLLDRINKTLCPKDASGNLLEPDNVFSYIHVKLELSDTGSGTGKVTIEPFGTKAYIVNSIGLNFKKNINMAEDTTDVSARIGWNLGFMQDRYFGSTSYTSDTTVEMNTLRYVYLGIDDYQRSVNSLFTTVFGDKPLSSNILARISMSSDNFTVIMENNYNLITEPRRYFGPVDIQKLRVQLFDDHGRPLDINNSNFSFVLTLKILYNL